MENIELKFKTNLNCGACVSKVKQALDAAENISQWHVDTNTPDKILTVASSGITAEEVIAIIHAKGFKIQAAEN